MAYRQLVKNFEKIREYMRDFYINGFKARGDYTDKSARTYDDERRRIESYLGALVRWESDARGRRVYISLDAADIEANPLYAAWKSKSFTDNDITLHFAILSALRERAMGIAQLTDAVCERTGGKPFDAQTVRLKANEYVDAGVLVKCARGKAHEYALSECTLESLPCDAGRLLHALRFFAEAAPLGYVGSTLLDRAGARNEIFGFKHHYIVHTLDDGVLARLLCALRERRGVRLSFRGRTDRAGLPLRIYVSVQNGRRYVAFYERAARQLRTVRLDSIQRVEIGEADAPAWRERERELDLLQPYLWGVSVSSAEKRDVLRMVLDIDEAREGYVLERLRREGRGGVVRRVAPDVFEYVRETCDASEMMPWIKSFTGRIRSLTCSNRAVEARFYGDMRRMCALYGVDGDGDLL